MGSVTDEVWRLNLDSLQSSIKENEYVLKESLILNQIYPNPFSNSITIEYKLKKPVEVTISIYNHLGQKVKGITERKSVGQQKIEWSCKELPVGIYFCVLKTNKGIQTTKMIKS